VVLRAEATTTEEILKQHCRERIAHFKVPTTIHFVQELPKTATGKIQKYVLRQGRSAISQQ
jgi:fatty-acyl-CoA synthase